MVKYAHFSYSPMPSLGRKSLVVLISKILSSVLSLVGLIMTSRYLGPEINGQVSWAIALVTTFNSISDFGFASAHVKRISEGKDVNDCLSTYTVIKLLLTLGMVVGTSIYLLVWKTIDPFAISSSDMDILILIILYCVFYNISSLFWTTYEARMESVKAQLVSLAEPLSRTPLMILVALLGLGAISLAYTYVIGAITMCVVGLVLMSREQIKLKRPTLYRQYWVFALPVSLITVFGTLSWNLDKLVIEAFGGTTAVAFFSQPQTLLGVLGFIGGAVTSLTFPAFSRMHTSGDIEGIRDVTRQSERYISMIALPVVIVLVLFPTETITTFLGDLYQPAAEPLRYLSISTYISLLSMAYSPQISGTNRPDLSAKLIGMTLVLNAVLLFVFVPSSLGGVQMLGLGVVGAALVSIIVSFVYLVVVRNIVFRLTETRSNPRILLHVLCGVLSGVVLFAIFQFYPILHWWQLLFYGVIEIPIFFGLMVVVRELTKNDMTYFYDVVHPRHMWDYISDEMKMGKHKK